MYSKKKHLEIFIPDSDVLREYFKGRKRSVDNSASTNPNVSIVIKTKTRRRILYQTASGFVWKSIDP